VLVIVIGIDTNVLVRYLTDDDHEMADRAERLLDQECHPDNQAFINAVVLCETAWVLGRRYRYSRAQIVAVIAALLRVPSIAVEHGELVEDALDLYRYSNVDFTDVLIGVINRRSGGAITATFDRKAAGLETFRLL
jgi:predicted nucleic-acid-binding protein